MADLHIDDFYKDSGLILIALYNNFPRPITLYIEDIAGPDHTDQYGLHSERHLSCLGTVLWLAEEGYIRYQHQVKQQAFDHCRLSHKSLRLLTAAHINTANDGSKNTSNSPQRQAQVCHINQLKSAIEARDSTIIATITRELLFL